METKTMTITPELARRWLKNMRINRLVKQDRVAAYARDMAAGRWRLNGESMNFIGKDCMVDGQHRCLACIKANTPFRSLVNFGIEKKDADIYDAGTGRSFSDAMRINEIPPTLSNNLMVAIAKMVYPLKRNQVKARLSQFEVQDFIIENKETFLKISKMKKPSNEGVNTKSAPLLTACVFALESGYDQAKIQSFIEIVGTGIPKGEKGDFAAIRFRNDIIKQNIIVVGGDSQRFHYEKCAEKALLDYLQGRGRTTTYKNVTERVFKKGE